MNKAIATFAVVKSKYTFLTAKSGAGKTYFANQLKEHGYKILELDVVVANVGKKFGIVGPKAFAMYKNGLTAEVMKAFVNEIHKFFRKWPKNPVVIEGAISDPGLINRIFNGQYSVFTFVYLYPTDVRAYAKRMMQRFKDEKKQGVRSLSIWTEITPELESAALASKELKAFMKKMARESTTKSKERYDAFVSAGFTIYKVEV